MSDEADLADLTIAYTDLLAERDSLRAALERLAMVDPLYEAELPFINASRELEARMAFAREALDSNR